MFGRVIFFKEWSQACFLACHGFCVEQLNLFEPEVPKKTGPRQETDRNNATGGGNIFQLTTPGSPGARSDYSSASEAPAGWDFLGDEPPCSDG